MKRLVLLATAGIVAVGAGASLVILSITESWTSGATPAPAEMAEVRRAVEPAAPGEPRAVIQPERPAQPGFRRLQIPPRIAARDVTAPIAECLRAHPTSPGGGAVLTLELEALASGGLRIVAAPVAAWGNASRALVACAQQILPGRMVAVGEYPPGERFRARYDLESAATAAPAPEPPVATALPARQPARRGPGGGRR